MGYFDLAEWYPEDFEDFEEAEDDVADDDDNDTADDDEDDDEEDDDEDEKTLVSSMYRLHCSMWTWASISSNGNLSPQT